MKRMTEQERKKYPNAAKYADEHPEIFDTDKPGKWVEAGPDEDFGIDPGADNVVVLIGGKQAKAASSATRTGKKRKGEAATGSRTTKG